MFRLSEAFGAWRVVDRDGGRVYDFAPLQGDTIEEDLAQRDFTVNAMARPRGGRRADRPARRPRGPRGADAAGARAGGLRERPAAPAAPGALRRRAGLRARRRDRAAHRATRRRAWRRPPASACSPSCAGSSSRRRAATGSRWPTGSACSRAVLPELADLHDVEQSHYHHLDVYGHTLEVLERLIELERRRPSRRRCASVLDEPLADELTRGAGAPLRRAPPRHRQAGHARRARGRPRDVHRPRPARRGDGARDLPPAAHERAAQPLPRGG